MTFELRRGIVPLNIEAESRDFGLALVVLYARIDVITTISFLRTMLLVGTVLHPSGRSNPCVEVLPLLLRVVLSGT